MKIIILCGPTAVGKTAAALELARRFPVEIVSADSGQIYRGMEIGTSKPTPEERSRVPFHLLDVVDPSESFSAAQFRRTASEAIDGILGRGRLPLVVGGTGLYIKVLTGGIFEGPERDPLLRERLEEEWKKQGPAVLHRRLQEVDPEAAAAIPPANRQRLIRALEVTELTGQAISSFWRKHRFEEHRYEALKIGLNLPPEGHREKISERVDRMFSQGLVREGEGLLARYGRDAPGLKLIGYRETVAHVEGRMSEGECRALVEGHTRQYAKRQKTWFCRDLEIRWHSPYALAEITRMIEQFRSIE